jgi:metal-responsive CopG/Arc/MetJ family transcriptional regulator
VRVPIVVNEYSSRKEIIRKMIQMRIRHQVEEKWHNIIEGDW